MGMRFGIAIAAAARSEPVASAPAADFRNNLPWDVPSGRPWAAVESWAVALPLLAADAGMSREEGSRVVDWGIGLWWCLFA